MKFIPGDIITAKGYTNTSNPVFYQVMMRVNDEVIECTEIGRPPNGMDVAEKFFRVATPNEIIGFVRAGLLDEAEFKAWFVLPSLLPVSTVGMGRCAMNAIHRHDMDSVVSVRFNLEDKREIFIEDISLDGPSEASILVSGVPVQSVEDLMVFGSIETYTEYMNSCLMSFRDDIDTFEMRLSM